jgi:glycosyltransferase involved in cell wall biosynthesis
MTKKIAIVTTHPIQYYAPLFKLLAQQIELKVFYTWGKNSTEKFDPGFGKTIQWDVPLLEGYDYQFLQNTAQEPGTHHFKGIKNPTITKEILEYNPTAILVIGWGYISHLRVLRYFKGKIPVYFRGDSTLLDNEQGTLGSIKNLLRRFFLIWVYSHVDKVFYVGTESKSYFKWALIKESQLAFTPHSIDNSRYSIDYSEKANELRKSLSIPKAHRIILFAGKFEAKKNPSLLLESFIEAPITNLHLVFLGNGDEEKALKERAKLSSKNTLIHFVDFQNQSLMPIWYNIADVFCLPSKGPGETWGLAVNEAMACGKAIVISDKVGCAKDLVKEGVNGWIFESGNEKQLQTIIENLPSKTILLDRGLQSKKIISDWSLQKTADNILKDWRNI